jgi:aminoglycoside phosphotransferase
MQPSEPAGFTACFSRAGLGEGTNAGTIVIAAPNGAGIDFAIHGIAYHKADTDNISVTAHSAQAVSTKCLYLVQINSAGTVSTKKGDEVATTDLTAGIKALQWPKPDADCCPIGGYKVETDASTTFTNGTTDLGAAGITDTYYNFAGGMPSKPLTS